MKRSVLPSAIAAILLTGCGNDLVVQETDFYDDMTANVGNAVAESASGRSADTDADIVAFKRINDTHNTNIPRDDIERYYDIIGPEAMLDVIEQDSYCHDKGHNIGKVVYDRTEGNLSEAMRICEQRCTSGCFHGILMEKFGELTGEEVGDDHVSFYQIEDEITNICDDESIASDIGVGDCVHGVGHAVMFLADYYVPRAIEACNLFEEDSLAYYCSTGVYMERDLVYGTDDLKEDLPFYPCDEQRDHPAACYRYKIRRMYKLSTDSIPVIKNDCMTLPTREERAGCFHGLGMAYFKWIRRQPEEIGDLCASDDALVTRLCIEGVIGKLSAYSRSKAQEACESYEDNETKEVCMNARTAGNFGMSKDFSLYHHLHEGE